MDLRGLLNTFQGSSSLGNIAGMVQQKLAQSGILGGQPGKPSSGNEAVMAEMTLYIRALMEILIDRGIISRQELEDKVREMDLRDGVQDGK